MSFHPNKAWVHWLHTIDNLIRDYLMQRGFNNTLKTFDTDLKQDKDKGFRADKIVQYVLSMVNAYDLDSLRSYWNHLDTRCFCKYEKTDMETVKKLEYSLYRYYVINCLQNGKKKECIEFFEKMNPVLFGVSEWREWFGLPFTLHPETHKYFAPYFTKQWSDTFLVSLHNFLSVTYARMPAPDLIKLYQKDQARIEELEGTIKQLQASLEEMSTSANELNTCTPADKKDDRPNYVKAMGIPGSLAPKDPYIMLPHPLKKKLPFGLSSKKGSASLNKPTTQSPKQTLTSRISASKLSVSSNSTKPQPKDQVASDKSPASEKVASVTEKSFSVSPTASVGDIGSPSGLKKMTNYQMQRMQLLSGSSNAAKSEKEVKMPVSSSAGSLPLSSSVSSMPTNALSANTTNGYQTVPTTAKTVSSGDARNNMIAVARAGVLLNFKQRAEPKPYSEKTLPAFQFPPSLDNPLAGTLCRSHIPLSTEEYQEHHSAIVQCRFDKAGRAVASCDKDGIVKVWSFDPVTTFATVMSRSPFLSVEWCGAVSDLLLLGTSSGLLRLYNTSTKLTLQNLNSASNYPHITQISCNPMGNSFATSCVARAVLSKSELNSTSATMAGRLQIWSLRESLAEAGTILYESVDNDIRCLTHNTSGSLMASGDAKGNLTLYDTRNYTLVMSREAHQGAIYSVQFSESGDHVLTLGADGKLKAWDTNKTRDSIDFPVHSSIAGPFEVSGYGGYKQVHQPSGGKLFALEPGGKHMLTCKDYNALMYRVDLQQGSLQEVLILKSHRSPVLSVDWASALNCGHCVSGSMDGSIQIATLLNQDK